MFRDAAAKLFDLARADVVRGVRRLELLLDGGHDGGAGRVGEGRQLAQVVAGPIAARAGAGRAEQDGPLYRPLDLDQLVVSDLFP